MLTPSNQLKLDFITLFHRLALILINFGILNTMIVISDFTQLTFFGKCYVATFTYQNQLKSDFIKLFHRLALILINMDGGWGKLNRPEERRAVPRS